MPVIRLLADMNISPQTVEALRLQGWDILRVPDLLPVHASDEAILNYARQVGRVVITQDLDFSALLALGGFSDPSLITLRLSVSDPDTITKRLQEIVLKQEKVIQEGCAVTIEDEIVRIRRLPIE